MSSEEAPSFRKPIMKCLFHHCLQLKHSLPTLNCVCTYIHAYIYTYIHVFSLTLSIPPPILYLSIYLSICHLSIICISSFSTHPQVISLMSSTRKPITRQCWPETSEFPFQVPLLGGKLGLACNQKADFKILLSRAEVVPFCPGRAGVKGSFHQAGHAGFHSLSWV